MKNVLGISGVIAVALGYQLVGDGGSKAAIIFLGGSMCFSAFFLAVYPLLDSVIAESSRNYYLRKHQEYIRRHEEMLLRMKEEMEKKS